MGEAGLDVLVAAGDWRGISARLSAMPEQELDITRGWYARGGRVHAQKVANDQQYSFHRPDAETADYVAVRAILAATFAPSAENASSWMRWKDWHWTGSTAAQAAIIEALARRGRDWCGAFVASAQVVRMQEPMYGTDRITNTLMPLIRRFNLPAATGAAFIQGWGAHYATVVHSASPRAWANQPKRPPTTVPWIWLDENGRAVIDTRPITALTLAETLAEEPNLAESLSAALAAPKVMARLIEPAEPRADWDFGGAIASLTVTGRLDRARVVDDCLDALSRRDTPQTQKAVAQILIALGLTADDLRVRLPAVQTVLAIAHGFVTSTLLRPALDSLTGADELDELARTIFGRTEKKQQSVLLAALTAPDAVDRFGSDAVEAGLRAALGCGDLRISQAAASRLGALREPGDGALANPASHEPSIDETLWHAAPADPDIGRLARTPPTAAALTRLESSLRTFSSVTTEAEFMDALTQFAAKDPTAALEWLGTRTAEHQHPVRAVRAMLRRYSGEDTPREFARAVEGIGRAHSRDLSDYKPEESSWSVWSLSTTSALAYLLEMETAQRLGTAPGLLSTPSLNNGVILFDDLVERIRSFGSKGFATFDLFQALLRLERVDPRREYELGGLKMPLAAAGSPARRLFGRRGADVPDAARIVRRWVAEGGARYPDAHLVDGRLAVGPAHFPTGPRVFATVPSAVGAGYQPDSKSRFYSWHATFGNSIGVVPLWPEYIAAQIEPDLENSRLMVPLIAGLTWSGHASIGVHTIIARALAFGDAPSRLHGVDATLGLIGRGAFDGEIFTATCIRLLDAGDLPLARTAASFEQVILGGGLSDIWPSVVDIASHAITNVAKPTGLAEFVGLLRRYVAATPGRALPDAVHHLAGRTGSSKAATEARAALAAALEEEPTR